MWSIEFSLGTRRPFGLQGGQGTLGERKTLPGGGCCAGARETGTKGRQRGQRDEKRNAT